MAIKLIEQDTKWKIVASSFIFDPSSAVKELIDNSIDSDANTIYIDIDSKTGGCEYIHVRDTGIGVPMIDRDQMCLNYTTSKIDSLSNLDDLKSLGFRGEALFHLTNLANQKGSLQLITRTKDETCGEKWYVQKDGTIDSKTRCKISSTIGTSITIRNLMGGLRARKIDLTNRARQTIDRLRHLVYHYSLIFNNIRFIFSLVSLNKNGSVANKQLQISSSTKLTRIRALANLIKLKKQNKIMENFINKEKFVINSWVTLDFILPILLPRNDIIDIKKKYKFLSVNDRPMSLQLQLGHSINKILNKIYTNNNFLEPKVWFININCQSNIFDLNVEPEKNDVLIKNLGEILNDIELKINQLIIDEFQVWNVEHDKAKDVGINKVIDLVDESIAENEKDDITIVDVRMNDRKNSKSTAVDVFRKDMRQIEPLEENTIISQNKSRGKLFAENDDNLILDENTTLLSGDSTLITETTAREKELQLENKEQQEKVKQAEVEKNKTSEDYSSQIWERDYMNERLQTSSSQNGAPLRTSPSIENHISDYDNNHFDSINDDIELSKYTSLSNPFTIVKLKSFKNTIKNHKNVATPNKHSIPIEQEAKVSSIREEMTNSGKIKIYDRKRNFDQINVPINFNNTVGNNMVTQKLNKLKSIHGRSKPSVLPFPIANKRVKKIRMFGEYTTIYETRLKVKIERGDKIATEDQWLQRDRTDHMHKSIRQKLSEAGLNPHQYCITQDRNSDWFTLAKI